MLADCSVAVCFENLSDAERLSIRRLTIRRQLFVLCSPSEATDNQLAGQRTEGFEFVFFSGIERRTAINRATDFMPDCVNCVLCSRSWAERASVRGTTFRGHWVCGSLLRHRMADGDQLREDFMLDCVIVFVFVIMCRTTSFRRTIIRGNCSERFTDNHSQASARHHFGR